MTYKTGTVALVTGAGRGIGRATALELARRGADVVLVARSVFQLEETALAVRALGRRALVLPIDLVDGPAVHGLIDQVEQIFGPVVILINNAALVGPLGSSWMLDSAEWERTLYVNLTVPFLLVRRVIPAMLAGGWGRIVNVSSGIVQSPAKHIGAYVVSKAALDMLTRQLALELAQTNVTITSVYPGLVDTRMSATVRRQAVLVEMASTMQQLYENGEFSQPEVPARLIAALVSTVQTVYNGQIIDIQSELGQTLLAG